MESHYIDKLYGLAYGLVCRAPPGEALPQLKKLMGSIATGEFDIKSFVGQMLESSDAYVREIAARAGEDPVKAIGDVYEEYSKKEVEVLRMSEAEFEAYRAEPRPKIQIDNPIVAFRAMPLGLFAKWEEYSTAASMATHASHECILSSLLVNSAVRSIITDMDTTPEKILEDIEVMLQYGIQTSKVISQDIYDELCLFFDKPLRRKIRSINGGEPEYTAFNVANTALAMLQRYMVEPSAAKISAELATAAGGIVEAENKDMILAVSAALMCCHCGIEALVAEHGENETSAAARELVTPFMRNIQLLPQIS